MKKVFYIVVLALVFSACHKVVFDKDKASADPRTNFDYFWNELNDKYSYFELKNVDWDSVYNVYFDMLNPAMTDLELFDVMKQMLFTLKDDHSNLVSGFDVAAYNIYAQYPKNFDGHLIYQLFPDLQRTGAISHAKVPGENIAYLRYSSFMDNFSDDQLDYILTQHKNTDGLILDLRENGGGVLLNVPKLLSRFAKQQTLAGYSRTKVGPGKDNFGDLEPFNIGPSEMVNYHKPVVVLIDRGSYSATTFFAAATKALDNVTLIGVPTGGGAGLPHGGQLPNGWTYRFSVSQFLYPNHDLSAENGVEPDVLVNFDWTNPTHDEILATAINFLQ